MPVTRLVGVGQSRPRHPAAYSEMIEFAGYRTEASFDVTRLSR